MKRFKRNTIKIFIERIRMDLSDIAYEKKRYEFIRRAGIPGEFKKYELKKRSWFVWAWAFIKRTFQHG